MRTKQRDRTVVHSEYIRAAAHLHIHLSRHTQTQMYPSTNYAQYTHSQPNVNIQNESGGIPINTSMPINLSLSQPTAPQPTYPQQTVLYASQPQNSIPDPNPTHLQPTEQHWQTVSRKRGRKTERQENSSENKQDYWLGGTIPTTNRYSTLQKNTWRNQPSKALNRNHHQSSYQGSQI